MIRMPQSIEHTSEKRVLVGFDKAVAVVLDVPSVVLDGKEAAATDVVWM